jgi:hypothetical protein
MPKNPLTFLPGYTEPARKRLPGEFIGLVFDPATRERLFKDLARILHGTTDERRAKFLEAAELAIDLYHKIDKPFVADQEGLLKQLDRWEKALREVHEATYALGAFGSRLIAQQQSRMLADPLRAAKLEKMTLEMADWAKFTADAIRERRGAGLRRRKGRTGPAMSALIENMARTYARVFGEQPSAAREGYFMQASTAILKAANLPTVGEKAVRRILEQAQLHAPRPRRGRKPGCHANPTYS